MKLLIIGVGITTAGVVSECFWKVEMWLTDFKSKHFDKLSLEIKKAKQRAETRLTYLLAVIPHAIDLTPEFVRDQKEEWMYQFAVSD